MIATKLIDTLSCNGLICYFVNLRDEIARRFQFGGPKNLITNYLCSCYVHTVHEKSILLPLLPATMLAMEEPFIFKWFMKFAMLSMFPLICRDGLIVPYFALLTLFILVLNTPGRRRVKEDNNYVYNYLGTTTIRLILFCSLILHMVYLTMQAPKKYPFLFEAMIMNLCFSQFVIVTIGCNMKQWMLNKNVKLDETEKKHIWHWLNFWSWMSFCFQLWFINYINWIKRLACIDIYCNSYFLVLCVCCSYHISINIYILIVPHKY